MRQNSDYPEEIEQKYSLFQIERFKGGFIRNLGRDDEQVSPIISERAFIYLETFESLKQAQIAQKENKQKTLILPSY